MSRTSSTFKKNFANETILKSSPKYLGGGYLVANPKLHTSPSYTKKPAIPSSFDFENFKKHLSNSLGCNTNLELEYTETLKKQINILQKENQHLHRKVLEVTKDFPIHQNESFAAVQQFKTLQAKMDELEIEEVRKEGLMHYLNEEINSLLHQIRMSEENSNRNMQQFTGDQTSMVEECGFLKREIIKREKQIEEIEKEDAHVLGQVNFYLAKQDWLTAQVSAFDNEGVKLTQAWEEKQTAVDNLLRSIHEAELRSADVRQHQYPRDDAVKFMREEIISLRTKLKSLEEELENDKISRLRMEQNRTHLMQDNAELQQRLAESLTTLDLEKGFQMAKMSRGRPEQVHLLCDLKDKVEYLERQREQLQNEVNILKSQTNQMRHKLNESESEYFQRKSLEPLGSFAEQTAILEENYNLQKEIAELKDQIKVFENLWSLRLREYHQLQYDASLLEKQALLQTIAQKEQEGTFDSQAAAAWTGTGVEQWKEKELTTPSPAQSTAASVMSLVD